MSVFSTFAKDKVYLLGVVPQFGPQKLHEIWLPIIHELEVKTGYKFRLVGDPTIPAFEKEFMKGKFDFAYMNPYHIVEANRKQGYIPLVRDHGRKLFGILTVRMDSRIKSVMQLHGKKIAFPSPNALGASLLMRADLINHFKIDFEPVYAKTHTSTYYNVALGLVDAGGGVMGTLNRQKKEIKDRLRVLYETKRVSPHPFAAHPRVPKKVREAVRNAFLKINQKLLVKVPFKKIGSSNLKDHQELATWGLEKLYVSE